MAYKLSKKERGIETYKRKGNVAPSEKFCANVYLDIEERVLTELIPHLGLGVIEGPKHLLEGRHYGGYLGSAYGFPKDILYELAVEGSEGSKKKLSVKVKAGSERDAFNKADLLKRYVQDLAPRSR